MRAFLQWSSCYCVCLRVFHCLKCQPTLKGPPFFFFLLCAKYAAAAKSLQSCPSLQPHRQQPTRLPHPWHSPGKNTGVGCHFLLQCVKVKVKSLSRVQLFVTPWTAAHQAPPSMGFSGQEYWSGVPLPSPCAKYKHYESPMGNV